MNKAFNVEFGAVIQMVGYDRATEIKQRWQALAQKRGGVLGSIRYMPTTMGPDGTYVPAISFDLSETKASDMLWYWLTPTGPVAAGGNN
jgi:hypothetical protein